MAETGGSSTISFTDAENTDDAVVSAGKAADTKEEPKVRRNRMRMLAERKRRNRVRNHFGELRALMPHVTGKCDKNTIVGHAIDYVQSLEQTKDMLEKLALARQVATVGAASSSSAPPQDAEGMVAMATAMLSDVPVPDGCHDDVPASLLQPLADVVPQPLQQQPLAAPVVPAPPPQLPTAAAGKVRFRTWSWPNLALNVSSDNDAYIKVYSPRHLGMQNMVMVLSVLNNHGIDVVAARVDSDAARSVLNIHALVTRMGGENPSSEEVYKLAMSEILLFLNTN